jgi:hypothetical protein
LTTDNANNSDCRKTSDDHDDDEPIAAIAGNIDTIIAPEEEESEISLDGFGSANITTNSTSIDEQADEEDDNAYFPDPIIADANKKFTLTKPNHQHELELELTPELKQAGIIERFAFFSETNAIHILLNHQYTRKSIVFSVDKKDWNKTHNIFEKQLKQKSISKEHILQLFDVLDNNYKAILSLGNRKSGQSDNDAEEQQQPQPQQQEKDKQKHKRRHAAYKYSSKGIGTLHEAILLAGQPVFITYDDHEDEVKTVQM